MIDIALINRTNRIRDARFADILPALQAQITDDFCPAWGVEPVTLHLVGKAEQPDPAHWKNWLLNTSDQPGDLGYHEDTTGLPESKIFVETDILSGSEISVTISHELLEMLADPTTTQMGPVVDGKQYIREIGDPVESDAVAYVKQGRTGPVKVSNFALPAYYVLGSAGPWDFRGLLPGPCPARLPGGYSMFLILATNLWGSEMSRYADGSLSPRSIRDNGRSWQRASRAAVS